MVNNSKPANKLEGTGLAGSNGGQAKSTNKMNIVMNKLITALNHYMEAPNNKKNNATIVVAAPNNKKNNATIVVAAPNNKKNNTTIIVAAPNNKKNNATIVVAAPTAVTPSQVNATNSKINNNTKPFTSRKNRVAYMKTQTFKGGRYTTYNKNRSRKNRK